MRITRIDHVAFATESVEPAAERFLTLLGLGVSHREQVADQQVDAAMVTVGDSCVEIVAPMAGDAPLRRFLERRGPGLHHLCLEVADLPEALDELARAGAELIDARPRIGARGRRIAFVHPRALGGLLLELVERPR
jgi:methylmalonyl-CoA/ethylmalonyl-CoA epimerase